MNITRLIVSTVLITTGAAIVKFGNQNYELLKEQGTVLLPILCLLAAIGLVGYGIWSFIKAFFKG